MAEAILAGLLKSKTATPSNIILSDPSEKRLLHLKKNYKAKTTKSNIEAVNSATIILLAVKPQVMPDVLEEIKGSITSGHLVISIAAGIKISFIKSFLGKNSKVIRVMPNTPALVGMGISAIASDKRVLSSDLSKAQIILNAVGKTVLLDERYLDAVTGLSGSGPAYFFLIIEALIEAGVAAGLSRAVSKELVIETAKGAVCLLQETGKSPAELREMVTSPGGTTVAGLKVLEEGALRSTIIKAVEAATARSKELSGK